jgi:NitT/TauT family transport system permease protein/putative hydroxymethylpyrimidine transport system permease protein
MIAALIVVALIGAWELYADLGSVDQLILPPPHAVASSLWDDRGYLWHNLHVTGGEVLLGIAVALAAGLVFALAMHLSATLRRAIYPLLMASQTIPIVVIAPLLVTWLGFDLLPKLFIVGLVCFFPVVVSTLDALASVDTEQLKLMRTLGATRAQTLWHVEAPSALPGLFSGAKIAVVTSMIGAVLAEQAGSSDGLGHVITYATGQLETAQAYAAVVLLSVFAVALFALLAAMERWAVPWARTRKEP